MPCLPVLAAQCRCLDAVGTACSLQRRRGLSVLRRPAHGPWRFQPSSGRVGHGVGAVETCQYSLAKNSSARSKRRRLSTLWSLCFVKATALSQPMVETSIHRGPNRTRMLEVSTRQRHASERSSHSLSAVAALRSCRLLAQSGLPNWSVKGTSRKRAAPYVER
jgi:hypothetical protein